MLDHFTKWEHEHKDAATGFLFSWIVVGNDAPDELVGGVHFYTTEHYFANADRPEQDSWYSELLQLTDGEPEWFDGTLAQQLRG